MDAQIIFHRLVQRDLSGILRFYTEEADEDLADQFYETFLLIAERALSQPKRYHFLKPPMRRARLPRFPYHFLYRETPLGIRVLVLRHDKRHPRFGLDRK